MQKDSQEHFFACSICLEKYQEPKVLACLHRFCEKCLHSYIVGLTSTTTNGKIGFQCPTCREFIPAPNVQKPPSDWAALFKTDFLLKSIMVKEKEKNKIVPKVEHPCLTHKDKDCDLFCVSCSRPVCNLCIGQAHLGCEQVFTLTEVAEDRRARIQAKLHDGLCKAEICDKIRNDYLSQMEREKCALEQEIKQLGQDLRDRVSSEENKLLKCLQEKYASLHETMSTQFVKTDESVAKLKDHVNTVLSMIDSTTDYDLLVDDSVSLTMLEIEHVDTIKVQQERYCLDNLAEVKIVFRKMDMPITSLGDIEFVCKPTDSGSVVLSFFLFFLFLAFIVYCCR